MEAGNQVYFQFYSFQALSAQNVNVCNELAAPLIKMLPVWSFFRNKNKGRFCDATITA